MYVAHTSQAAAQHSMHSLRFAPAGLRPTIQAALGHFWRDNGGRLARPPRRFPLAPLGVLRERLPLARHRILYTPDERSLQAHANFKATTRAPAIGVLLICVHFSVDIASEPGRRIYFGTRHIA